MFQDGSLCCSYNYHCGNDTAVGYDGVVAAPTAVAGHSAAFTVAGDRQTQSSDIITKQYSSAPVRVADNSADVVNVSDSQRSNKTDPSGG